MNYIVQKLLLIAAIAMLSVSSTACAGNDYHKKTSPPKKHVCGELHHGEECRAVVSVIRKKDGTIKLNIIDGQTGQKFETCELCPPSLLKKFGHDVEAVKNHCRQASKKRLASGKKPYCLVDTTVTSTTPLTINQSLSSDCIWFPFAGSQILINRGCLH